MSEVRQAESGDFLDDMEARAGGAGAAGAGAAAAAGAGDGASGGQCEHGIGSRVACRAAGVKPSV